MPPFTVLHLCMGNICRSPMAERLLALRVDEHGGDDTVLSHSAGIGHWHVGQPMNAPAARELASRGGSDAGFRARHVAREHVEVSDVILTATHEQFDYIAHTYPEALPRTFLIRHFGEIIDALQDRDSAAVDDGFPAPPEIDTELSPEVVYKRGLAIVAAADSHRKVAEERELDDPWGESPSTFTRIADEIDAALRPFVTALLG